MSYIEDEDLNQHEDACIGFISFKEKVANLIQKTYGIEYNDFTDDDELRQVFDEGDETPLDFVQRVGNKRDLDPIDTPFM